MESSEKQPALPNRQTPFSEAFRAFIGQDWAPHSTELPARLPAAEHAPARREAIGAQFPGERLVIPAGGFKVRSNDTDYRYRPHSAFAHLTGLGEDREPDAVLVLEPSDNGHEPTLYFKPRAPRDAHEFYADPRYGEMWVGKRESLEEMSALTGIACASIDDLRDALAKNADSTTLRLVAGVDPEIERLVAEIRAEHAQQTADRTAESAQDEQDEQGAEQDEQAATTPAEADQQLVVALSELRLRKDAFEADQLREACRQTAEAFAAVVAELPEAVRRGRGERWVEGVFGLHARHSGNAIGYDTIAAAGEHACTLHWIRNDGELREDQLILIDAGVEVDTLYTADVTRTLPVGGRFSEAQREVYGAVLEAQEAGIAAARAGAEFADVHKAAIAVIARRLEEWGILPVSAEESLGEEGGQHRRWMVHGTSHHLGLDVHDCAQARTENYRQGTLAPGMVITVEPGLYFKADDLLVPERFRGIGVRIEDDILITEDGNENLSAALPRTADDVEAWMAPLLRH
ncbi:Xaa-Pro aminopeptidase [Friedmanniella endophytica]|uniref:Xaa-Pro aminopeptidase n=1 Tax=Microlunatus kandeliicorticis TaxID=1759536 RepID=A0A7W3ISK8_9ACTN|nr:aminopeptidase P family protein [Microlunatus kandeliicorticis]MBA8794466.1 Xaa-Pro aminopeptidase [Microlunatus kandeliicorticis]